MVKKKKAKNNIIPIPVISNTSKPKTNIKNPHNPESVRAGSGFAFDVSFEALYYSVEHGDFNNFLKNERHFIEKFKEIRRFIKKATNKNFNKDLIRDKGMNHCHKIVDEKYDLAIECVKDALIALGNKNSEDVVTQLLGGENLYQIGFEGEIRYIGTYDNERNIFRVYLIDYHHRLFPDERHNKYNDRNLKYCVMSAD